VHGSAPDIAGQGIANPIGQIWCASMMLDWLGHADAAAAVLRAIESVLCAGPKHAPLTRDVGGTASTAELGGRSLKRSRPKVLYSREEPRLDSRGIKDLRGKSEKLEELESPAYQWLRHLQHVVRLIGDPGPAGQTAGAPRQSGC